MNATMGIDDSLLLAVDGGQTHSMAIVARTDGTVIGAGSGGPANHFLEPGGPERFSASMRSCIEGAFYQAGLVPCHVQASHYSLTGVHTQMENLLKAIVPSKRQSIQPDRLASIWGATQERPAILILSGTGAIAYGIDSNGHDAVTGGWGYYMGDEGSASWIAPRALSFATRAVDDCGAPTILSTEIPAHYGVSTLRELHPLIYTHQIDRVKLAEIAGIVGHCAENGDPVAIDILAESGRYLAEAVMSIIRKLMLENSHVTVTSAGGVFKSGQLVTKPMMLAVQRAYPCADYVAPQYPPIVGALILAMRSCGIDINDQVHRQIQATASVWSKIK